MRPANGRATSSLLAGNVPDSHRPSQFRHVYQVLNVQARPNAWDRDAGLCITDGEREEIYRARCRVKRPGPACGLVLLGDPPSFDENDANPHCCVKPQRCSCRAVACGDRGVSFDMGRRPLVRRRWRHGSPFPACQGMPPPIPRPPRSPRQFQLRSRTLLGPVVLRELSEGFTRLPHCRVGCYMLPVNGRHILLDSPPPPFDRVAYPCRRGASPPVIRDTCAPRVAWHLGCGCRKLRLPRPCRIPAGCPVSRSVGVASNHTAIQRRQNGVSVPLAPRWHQNRMFSSLAAAALHADLAPRHYRFSAMLVGLATVRRDDLRRRQRGSDGRPSTRAVSHL